MIYNSPLRTPRARFPSSRASSSPLGGDRSCTIQYSWNLNAQSSPWPGLIEEMWKRASFTAWYSSREHQPTAIMAAGIVGVDYSRLGIEIHIAILRFWNGEREVSKISREWWIRAATNHRHWFNDHSSPANDMLHFLQSLWTLGELSDKVILFRERCQHPFLITCAVTGLVSLLCRYATARPANRPISRQVVV